MRFYQDHAPIDCIQHCHWLSYAKDFLGKFNLPIVSLCEGDRLTGMSHVELRHDVDRQLDVAIAMAHIERNLGVTATYFFLHPDGVLNRSNYFGYIKKNRVHIAPAFIEAALEIQDMGHEIGLHNDLISLWIGTGISPKDHLEEILACLRGHGIRVSGTAAHGSRLCHMHHYINYQIFKEKKASMAEDIPESITINGKKLKLHSLAMSDFDLSYEACLKNYSIYISDSGNMPVLSALRYKCNLTKDNIDNEIIADQICKFEQPSTIQCLVHPDHWSIQLASGNGNIKKGLDDIENRFLNSKKQTKLFIIENSPSILYANIQNIDSSYNQAYNKNVFHFPNQASWLNSLFPSLESRLADNKVLNVLELGCGRGDFLAALMEKLHVRTNDAVGIGVDASFAAVADCVAKYPHLRWIVDNGENFLDNVLDGGTDSADIPRQYDLILDKTGLTAVPDFDSAYAVLKKIARCVSTEGSYIYMASAEFHARRYADQDKWPLSWIQTARRIFPFTGEIRSDNRLIFEFRHKNESDPSRLYKKGTFCRSLD